MNLLSGLIINVLAIACLENQCNRYAILLPTTLIPIILTPITPTKPTTPKTLPLPFTPKAP